jgi:hypothetical protein
VPQTSQECLARVLEIADRVMDKDRIALGRRRQAGQFAWRPADYIPCVFGKDVPELNGLPEFDWKVQFHDPAASDPATPSASPPPRRFVTRSPR